MRVGVVLQGSIALRAVTIFRPETQKDKLKLTLANSSLFSDFFSLECHVCLSFVIKMRKMTKLRQKLHISQFDVVRAALFMFLGNRTGLLITGPV